MDSDRHNHSVLAFKRTLHVGMSGRDVKGVKIALAHAGYGYKLALKTRFFGHAMARRLKAFQAASHLTADGIYGPTTHKALAPHFTPYATWLYEGQVIPPVVPATAQAAARRLLALNAQGKYHDDRGTELAQIQATADGKPVVNAIGEHVYIQAKVMEVLVWLIDVKGFKIGTFALCSDHGFDSENGHAGGRAVDISSINGVAVTDAAVRIQLINMLHDLQSGPFRPWQLISGGYANHEDDVCKSLCIPSAAFYGEPTLSQHTNHVHVGF
jgi:hypothetical protein